MTNSPSSWDPDNDDQNAILGNSYDAAKKEIVENVNTSIQVIFNGALDGDSVDASDFTVDGDAVEAADWFSSKKDSVFLTVGEQDPRCHSQGGSGQRRHS